MTRQVLNPIADPQLERLFGLVAGAMTDTLQSLVDRPLQTHTGTTTARDGNPFDVGSAIIRGRLDGEWQGRFVHFQFPKRQALTIASLMMMFPDEVIIEKRRELKIGDEELDTLSEIGNVLCSGVDSVLADKLDGATALRFQSLEFYDDAQRSLGTFDDRSQHVVYSFKLQVSSYPAEDTAIVIDRQTAEMWSQTQGPLPPTDSLSSRRRVVDAVDEVPVAPLRGEMACFISDPAVMDVVRTSCRRTGLDLERHGVSEAPNPTAHKRGLVLLDVPLGQDRRFDWCKRLKHVNPEVRVILLVHHPSKARVLRGLMSRADVILGWPLDEPVLSERLNSLIEPSNR